MAFESSEPLRFPGPTSLWKLSCAAWDLVSAAATRPPFFPCEIRAAQVGAQGVPAGHASLRCKIKFVTDPPHLHPARLRQICAWKPAGGLDTRPLKGSPLCPPSTETSSPCVPWGLVSGLLITELIAERTEVHQKDK